MSCARSAARVASPPTSRTFATCASMSLREKYSPVVESTAGASRFPIDRNWPPRPTDATAITAARQQASATAAAALILILVGVDTDLKLCRREGFAGVCAVRVSLAAWARVPGGGWAADGGDFRDTR